MTGNKLTNGFERRKEQKKESIRRAALELFKTYGFEKVTINDIARGANVSQVTIYNHFGGKEDLVREVTRTLLQSLLEKYRAIIEGDGTFLEKLKLTVFDRMEMLSQFQGELTQKVMRVDPEIQEFVGSTWQQEVNQLTLDLFNEGKREGYVNHELSDKAILAFNEILRRGILASSNISNIDQDVQLRRDLMILFRYGLKGKTE